MVVRKVAIAFCATLGFSGTALADAQLIILNPEHSEEIEIGRNSLDYKGNVVGMHRNAHGNANGFIRTTDGAVTTVGPRNFSPAGLNDHGVVTGSAGSNAFVVDAHDTATKFRVKQKGLTGIHTAPMGINNKGFIAGNWWTNGTTQHGFVRDADGNITSFDAPNVDPGNGTTAMAISANGAVAGYFTDKSQRDHGFVLSKGKFKVIDVPGGQGFQATHVFCINGKGVVGGDYEGEGEYGFVMDAKGNATTFTFTNANFVSVNAINSNGDVTGSYHDSHTGHDVAFIRTAAGETTTFEVPNAKSTGLATLMTAG